MKLRVESDGKPFGTKVLTEDGRDISNQISSVSFTHNAGEHPRVDISAISASGVEGEMRFVFLDPRDGVAHEVARIEYTDGGSFEPAAE